MVVTADNGWTPGKFGVSTSVKKVNGDVSSISIRHHMFPFKREVQLSGQSVDENALKKVALEYLSALKQQRFIDDKDDNLIRWLDDLTEDANDSSFGWMPVRWPLEPGHEADPNAGDPFVSFRVERKSAGDLVDRTIMLLGAERLDGKFIGSGFGIAIVVNLRPLTTGKFEAQVAGFSASLPYGRYRNNLAKSWGTAKAKQSGLLKEAMSDTVRRQIESTLGLSSVSVRRARYYQVEGSEDWRVERYGTGKRRSAHGQVSAYCFLMLGTNNSAGELIDMELLQADAKATARLFKLDPASRGGGTGFVSRLLSRSDSDLDQYREPIEVPTSPSTLELDDGGHKLMRVMSCPDFVLADKVLGAECVKAIDIQAGGPPIRSDDFSALSAFYNVKQMFDRMIAYGLDPFDYFRFARLPLDVAYRSGMQTGPGRDGQIVNACVKVDGWDPDFIGPTRIGERPAMEMRLALADLSRRGRKRWEGANPSAAEPLGIAADDRWLWHEFGHVLLMGGVGELEFRFAHSAGDALAAIALDPDSKLATSDLEGKSYWRGLTFPCACLTRRHDRCVTDGWSWGGTMHSALASVPNSTPPRRKGYLSEQILSSSLFRLYRVLGGDTIETEGDTIENKAVDRNTRETASHYCLFLIMDAIRRLGIGPAVQLRNDPEQFVSALLDADAAILKWEATFPAGSGNTYRRTGGCAYKVIRWAFESQGLYTPEDAITNAPGLPPEVDVYIADGRASETTENGSIAYGKGNYAPVSLHWDSHQTGDERVPPDWQAARDAIRLEADGIHVAVGNRGTENADNASVSVYWIEWPENSRPEWNDEGWQRCEPVAQQSVPAGADNVSFGPFQFNPPAHHRYIVVAKVSCADDPAIPDAADPQHPDTAGPGNPDAAIFACGHVKTPLVDLITGDNNLGLRVVTLPPSHGGVGSGQ